MIEVLRAGATTVQDRGRPGLAHLGVPPSGALDRPALELANRLVGNPAESAGLEVTLGGPRLLFHSAALVALAGAPLDARLDGRPLAPNASAWVPAGAVLDLGRIAEGVRGYLAVRGGIDAEPVLGSRSHDQLTGLGPPPLAPGDQLALGAPSAEAPGVGWAPVAPLAACPVLRVVPGPREDRFTPGALGELLAAEWTATAQSNRIGLGLAGAQLAHAPGPELLSEPMVTGALQVPPSGRPILLLADHPTTGGYPVLAVVVDADVHLAAQVRPGGGLRFTVAG